MQGFNPGVAGNDDVRVVPEPLQSAIPDIPVNIIIGACGHSKKFNVPYSSQDESDDDNPSRKSWRSEELTDREEVGDSRNRQRGHEVWPTSVAEVARADR